jgi:hypothetical protein
MSQEKQIREAVDELWQADSLDPLYESLATRGNAVDHGEATDILGGYYVDDLDLPSIQPIGDKTLMATIKLVGQRWWEKFEPQIYDLLCNQKNPEHKKFVDALGGSAKELAVLLAPTLVASLAGALPAVVVVVATIAAKKIADSGLEAMCEVWAEARTETETEAPTAG